MTPERGLVITPSKDHFPDLASAQRPLSTPYDSCLPGPSPDESDISEDNLDLDDSMQVSVPTDRYGENNTSFDLQSLSPAISPRLDDEPVEFFDEDDLSPFEASFSG
jgi:hypothetical protein